MELKIDQETKICTKCNEHKPLENFYSYEKESKTKGKYIYYQPKCKDCLTKEYEENKEERNKRRTEMSRKNPQFKRDATRRYRKKNLDKISARQKKWRQDNPDKIRGYSKNRRMHKQHDITEQEWFYCLDYFNNTCAYCGLSEKEQIEIFNENFHMEHVDHNGSNYIDNCVPSCTSCNATKNEKEFNEWYNVKNPIYSKRRYNKIINWMTNECFKVLNLR